MADDALAELEAALGHVFTRRDLLVTALTHSSFKNEVPEPVEDNERLEFLGDAVLDLAVSQWLFREHPSSSEGELSQLRARVVDARSLAQIGLGLDLGDRLRMGVGEERTGGRRRRSLLADAVEAVIGAVYVDAGFEPANQVVLRLVGEALAGLGQGRLRDAKSLLQEWAQEHHRVTPRYDIISVEGPDHASHFEAEVVVDGVLTARGEGRSKKEAHQRAAEAALARIGADADASEGGNRP